MIETRAGSLALIASSNPACVSFSSRFNNDKDRDLREEHGIDVSTSMGRGLFMAQRLRTWDWYWLGKGEARASEGEYLTG